MNRIPIRSSSVVVAVVIHRPLSPHNANCWIFHINSCEVLIRSYITKRRKTI